MKFYRIARANQETQCDQCGMPLYTEDGAYETGWHVGCSRHCATLLERQEQEQQAHLIEARQQQKTLVPVR